MAEGIVIKPIGSMGGGMIKDNDGKTIRFDKTSLLDEGSELVKGDKVTFDIINRGIFQFASKVVKVGAAEQKPAVLNPAQAKNQPKQPQKCFAGKPKTANTQQPCKQEKPNDNRNGSAVKTVSPYGFKVREKPQRRKPQYHSVLDASNYDIAFDISWKTLTPTALNPCIDPDEELKCFTTKNTPDKEGPCAYDKRWLMIGNRLAISPFTVKSAIANGFANLLGSCYRVNNKIEGHKDKKEGHYPYGGGYKRYRVDLGNSKPGILTKKPEEVEHNGKTYYHVEVRPVTEYYCDFKPSFPLQKRQTYFAKTTRRGHKHFITSLDTSKRGGHNTEVIYYGPYKFGMNLSLEKDNLDKNHLHRFYSFESKPRLEGCLPEINFKELSELKKNVYTGSFKRLPPSKLEDKWFNNILKSSKISEAEKDIIRKYKDKDTKDKYREEIFVIFDKIGYNYDPRSYFEGCPWYDDIKDIPEGTFVYYQEFNGSITNIGRNFLFKALFFHEDTVPDGHEECDDLKNLCPRCRMFGMSGKTEDNDSDGNSNNDEDNNAIGFKGRFKSSTLINPIELKEDKCTKTFDFIIEDNGKVTLKKWIDKANPTNEIAQQVLLPIQAEPKPNKRDKDGYYDKTTGQMKGAKFYKHATPNPDSAFAVNIDKVDDNNSVNKDYAHHLRNYAQVCKDGLVFTGTVGAENCSLDEIAALLLLLHSKLADHGFKIGLGKAFGMGSISSSIKRIWIKNKSRYEWTKVEIDKPDDIGNLKTTLEKHIEGITKELCNFAKAKKMLNSTQYIENTKLEYPDTDKYWNKFNNRNR
ncbi:hypothetical protein MCHI_004042 [Candidatus Magnetoovum chiemensis]|nr:hypothetical protein MCHI_004042 [Candidatus Magnetoovum chiemensis]